MIMSDLSQQTQVECRVETMLPGLTREPPGLSVQYTASLHHRQHHQQLSLTITLIIITAEVTFHW